MPDPDSPSLLPDLEDSREAFNRIKPELESMGDRDLSLVNVDLEAAASTALGVVPVLAAYRDRIALLGDFDLRNVDKLPDYAVGTWYLHVTGFQQPEPFSGLEQEVDPLRRKLLRWVPPLVQTGIFNQGPLDRIRRSRGLKTKAADLVTLVALYRASWDQIRTVCAAVTEEDLERASLVGSAVFEVASRREVLRHSGPIEAALMVRKAWTLLDRSYTQCRRAITYLRYVEGDYESLIPSLRGHAGPRGKRAAAVAAAVEQEPETTSFVAELEG